MFFVDFLLSSEDSNYGTNYGKTDQDLGRLDNNGVSLSIVFIVIPSLHQQNIYNNTHKCLVSSMLSSEDSKNNNKFGVNLQVNRSTCKCRFIVNMTEYGYSEIFGN